MVYVKNIVVYLSRHSLNFAKKSISPPNVYFAFPCEFPYSKTDSRNSLSCESMLLVSGPLMVNKRNVKSRKNVEFVFDNKRAQFRIRQTFYKVVTSLKIRLTLSVLVDLLDRL